MKHLQRYLLYLRPIASTLMIKKRILHLIQIQMVLPSKHYGCRWCSVVQRRVRITRLYVAVLIKIYFIICGLLQALSCLIILSDVKRITSKNIILPLVFCKKSSNRFTEQNATSLYLSPRSVSPSYYCMFRLDGNTYWLQLIALRPNIFIIRHPPLD